VFSSSVGTKFLIALTGLALLLFLILHLAGNLLVFAGPSAFNLYSDAFVRNPLLIPAELGLLCVFAAHVYKTIRMWMENRRARPARYEMTRRAGYTSRKSLASSTMILTGLATLGFVVLHLKTFKYGPHYIAADLPAEASAEAGANVRDVYRLELEVFQKPAYVAFYVVCMVLIGFHLRHGISSAFQSLGIEHPRCTRRLLVAGTVMAVVIGAGFAIIPLWIYVFR